VQFLNQAREAWVTRPGYAENQLGCFFSAEYCEDFTSRMTLVQKQTVMTEEQRHTVSFFKDHRGLGGKLTFCLWTESRWLFAGFELTGRESWARSVRPQSTLAI
jgi:hypothetical protein